MRDELTLQEPSLSTEQYRDGPAEELSPPRVFMRAANSAYDSPWYFDSSGGGRFDICEPVDGADVGTCYLGSDVVACLVETVAKGFQPGVPLPRRYLVERSIWTCTVAAEFSTANLRDVGWVGLGLTLEIFTCPYELSHAWALELRRAGFEALLVMLRHVTDTGRHGLAYFGPSGPQSAAAYFTAVRGEVTDEVIRDFEHATRITVAEPPTGLAELDLLN